MWGVRMPEHLITLAACHIVQYMEMETSHLFSTIFSIMVTLVDKQRNTR